MKYISIIRNRGQLTIPDPIRKIAGWTSNSSAVELTMDRIDQITVNPFHSSKEQEWDKIIELINKAREIKGRCSESGFDFIKRDRETVL